MGFLFSLSVHDKELKNKSQEETRNLVVLWDDYVSGIFILKIKSNHHIIGRVYLIICIFL